MNEYKIYQVKEEHIREYGFCSLDMIRREHPDELGLPRDAWELVYTYETEKRAKPRMVVLLVQPQHGGLRNSADARAF